VQEAGFGNQTIRIVVSDNVLDLYLPDLDPEHPEIPHTDYNCDCISIETTKQSLSLADNKFGVDELKFTINEAATKNNDGNKYVNAFLLEASDRTKSRFIAVYFNPVYTSTANLILTAQFRGKVTDKISGQDLDWKNAIYSGTINPLREWKFTALSIDYALLEKVLIKERILLEDGNKIRGIFGHIEGTDVERITTAETDGIFKPRLAYQGITGTTNANWFYNHFYRLGSLYDALQLLFDKAGKNTGGVFSGILNEIYTDQNFVVVIDTSTLTIQTQPTGYRFVRAGADIPQLLEEKDDTYTPKCTVYAANKKIQLKIAPGAEANDTDSPIYINERMFDASLNALDIEPFKSRIASENSYNFHQCSNLAELLFTIARSLGCFVIFSLSGTNEIHVQFISRDSSVQSEITQIIDSTDASIDTSGSSNEGKMTTYSAIANTQAAEGLDIITSVWKLSDLIETDIEGKNYFPGEESEKLKVIKEKEKEKKNNKDIELKNLLFSTSQTLEYQFYEDDYWYPDVLTQRFKDGADDVGGNYYKGLFYQPMNIIHSSVIIPTTETIYQSFSERLHTALYIRVKKTNMAYDVADEPYYDVDYDYDLYCPAFGIHIKKNIGTYETPVWEEHSFGYSIDDEKNRSGLSDYINYLMEIDEQYYTQEYSLTVPYWSGFKKGANTNWKQLQLGSLIQLTWNVITYASGVFSGDTAITKTFVVNEIERDYQNVTTKLKLHYEGRFAYSGSSTASAKIDATNIEPLNIPKNKLDNTKIYIAASSITSGDAVMAGLSGGVVKVASSIPMQTYYGQTIGIALNSCNADENVFVQVMGTITNNAYDFTGFIGEYVYCQNKAHGVGMQGTTNISTDLAIPPADVTYDSVLLLGKIDSLNSFVLGIVEIPFEDAYSPPA
jgi:hypothetical protein